MVTIRLLYVHASEDEPLRQALEAHLSSLEHEGRIHGWHAGLLPAGSIVSEHLADEVARADVVVLLLSAGFLASKPCQALLDQVQRERAARRVQVVSVLARPVDWRCTEFEDTHVLPGNGRAVTSWPNQDEAWLDVVQGLRRLLTGGEGPSPPSGEGLFLRIDGLIEAHDLDAADRELARCHATQQRSPDYWCRRSRVAFGRSNIDVASAYIEEALKLDSRHVRSVVLRIKLLLLSTRRGDRDEAQAMARRSRGIDHALDAWLDRLATDGIFGAGVCSDFELEARCPAPARALPEDMPSR